MSNETYLFVMSIFNDQGDFLGLAASHGEAKKMHIEDFQRRGEKVLEDAYGGVDFSSGHPLFFMTEDYFEYVRLDDAAKRKEKEKKIADFYKDNLGRISEYEDNLLNEPRCLTKREGADLATWVAYFLCYKEKSWRIVDNDCGARLYVSDKLTSELFTGVGDSEGKLKHLPSVAGVELIGYGKDHIERYDNLCIKIAKLIPYWND